MNRRVGRWSLKWDFVFSKPGGQGFWVPSVFCVGAPTIFFFFFLIEILGCASPYNSPMRVVGLLLLFWLREVK